VVEFRPSEAVHAVREARRQLTTALKQRGGSREAAPGQPNQQRPGKRQRAAAMRRQEKSAPEATPADSAEAHPKGQGRERASTPPWVPQGGRGFKKGKGKGKKKGRKGKKEGPAAAGRGKGNRPTRQVQVA
jgi:hypothetical protein